MNHDNPHTIEEILRTLLTPRGFFLGMVLGFAACCVAGRKAPTLMPMANFQRFHRFLSPEGLYYPTALQVRALARRELPREKIAVIIGGSSVMQGVGQNAPEVWHHRLQAELGDEFCILNLATTGGAPNGHGQIAAEMMCREGRNIIHVCDVFLTGFADAPDGNRDVYRYLFHDAQARGLLLPCAQRDQAMRALAEERRDKTQFNELHLQARANRWLSFNDWWNVVAYEHAFTLWRPLGRSRPWQARKLWHDPPLATKNFLKERERSLVIVGEQARAFGPEEWERVTAQVRQSVPEIIRPRTLAVVNRLNPEFLQVIAQKEPGFQARYDRKIQEALASLRGAGLQAVEGCVTLAAEDFLDWDHLLPSGGHKLAVELAPRIRALADQLGYREHETAQRAMATP